MVACKVKGVRGGFPDDLAPNFFGVSFVIYAKSGKIWGNREVAGVLSGDGNDMTDIR